MVGLFRLAIKKNLYCRFIEGEKETEVRLLEFSEDTLFVSDASLKTWIGCKSRVKNFRVGINTRGKFLYN